MLLSSLLDGLAVQVALKDEDVTPQRARELSLAFAEKELGC
jgi:BetI-type transcriptional repressor, C-terminal